MKDGIHGSCAAQGWNCTNQRKKQTNADRISSMSDEELAEFLEKNGMCELCEHRNKENCFEENCKKGFLKWLQSEAEE